MAQKKNANLSEEVPTVCLEIDRKIITRKDSNQLLGNRNWRVPQKQDWKARARFGQ